MGVTDWDWYRLHVETPDPIEVNFWRPSARRAFLSLLPGQLFLFKLHSPRNYIVGGGFFARYSVLPISLAWEVFGRGNGATSLGEMIVRVQRYRRASSVAANPEIGCILLAEPFFLPETDWIQCPKEFPPNTVQGKGYDSDDPVGRRLWDAVQDRLSLVQGSSVAPGGAVDQVVAARSGAPSAIFPRLGQGIFRTAVTDEYQRRCSVTGERTLPALEAAHIRPYAAGGANSVNNGLLLRSDLHRLFDRGYVTVDSNDRRFIVSRRIKDDYENGREYYSLHGVVVRDTQTIGSAPSETNLQYHAENVFLG